MRISIKLQNSLSLHDNVMLAKLAEARGIDGIWVSEFAERDAITFLTILGWATERISVGASIIPFYTRSDVVLGMTAASLSEALPGRVRLGFGASTDVIVERWHGRERTSPMATARSSLARIRRILDGEQLEALDGSERPGFRFLADQPVGEIELLLAALGPKMSRLAGEVSDGVLLNMVAAEHVSTVKEQVGSGAAEAGREGSVPLLADVRVATSTDENALAEAREGLRRLVASYGRVGPYRQHYRTSGFEDQAEKLQRAFDEGGIDEAAPAVDDEMLDALVATGPLDAVLERLGRYHRHGLDELILYPTVTDGDEARAAQQIIDIGSRLKEGLS